MAVAGLACSLTELLYSSHQVLRESDAVFMGERRLRGASFGSCLANILRFIGITGDPWISYNFLCKMYQGTVDVTCAKHWA